VVSDGKLINGGCNFPEDPAIDARDVQPQWKPSPPCVVTLIETDEDDRKSRFSLWDIPGRKSVRNGGRQLHLTSQVGVSTLRLQLSSALCDGDPFAFVVSVGADARSGWAARARVKSILSRRQTLRSSIPWRRPTHSQLLHMRALQALDGVLAGASQREIAVVLFGSDVVTGKWHADGELRARVRYLIRRASALMNGGYRRLLFARK
jgi:hypothetical protein